MSDLERAFNALSAKTGTYNTLWQYADGDHPLTYTNERLREIFRSLDARFTENWCSLVLGACLERIEMQGWQVAGDEVAQAILQALWEGNDLDAQADEVHEAALVCGESFVIVWPDADGQPQVYYNDPRMVHVFYDDESPSMKTFGAKWWNDANGKRRLTLYYADRLEYYVSLGKEENMGSAAAFMADPETPTAPNPFGEIPVFHFRTSIRTTKSDLKDVIPIQNGINKLLADMMVAAEYGAFKQRYIISNADGTGKLKNAPNEIWDVPAGDGVGQQTQVGEFSATDLRNYLDAIDRLALAVGIITRTPKYYFMAQGGDPSGEALIAMEAPLNKKASKRISRFLPTWRQVGAFMLKVSGQETPESDGHAGVRRADDDPAGDEGDDPHGRGGGGDPADNGVAARGVDAGGTRCDGSRQGSRASGASAIARDDVGGAQGDVLIRGQGSRNRSQRTVIRSQRT